MDPVGVLNALLDVICSPACLVDIVVDPVGVTGLKGVMLGSTYFIFLNVHDSKVS